MICSTSTTDKLYYRIHGGAKWEGGSYDSETSSIITNSNDLAWDIMMCIINAKKGNSDTKGLPGVKNYLQYGCSGCHGQTR